MKKIFYILATVFSLISSLEINAQYCGLATTNTAITPTTTAQLSASFNTGRIAFNFAATAGCTYVFETCGLSTADTYLRLYSTATGGTLLATGDDNCGAQSRITWTCVTSGNYSILLTNYVCAALNVATRMRYSISGCTTTPYNPCTTIPTIAGCGTSATAAMTGTGAGWSVTTCGFATPGQERLFQFTAPTTGTYTLNVSAITGGYVDFFWKPASSGCNVTGWNCIDDIAITGTYAAVAPMTFTAGTTYYILLDPEGTGTFNTTFNLVCPAAAVANDLVCNATAISCGQTLNGTTLGANNASTGENLTCGTAQTMPGVWYVVPGNGQIMTASLCGTAWDSKISVFNGTNCSALTCIGGVDDLGPACATTSASFSWTSVVGQNYYILVHGYATNQAFALALTCTNPCLAPSNDLCANAPILNLGTNNNQTHLGTGSCSTPNLGTYKDVWVAFTVPCGGMNIAIDFCGSTPVHNNAYLNIFSDCTLGTFTGAANWDFTSCPDGNIKLFWNNVPAGTYYYPILIDPAWETNYTLNISGTPLHTPATAPTSISGTSTICGGQNTTLTLQGGSAGTNGTPQWFEGSCASAVIGTGNAITVSPANNTTYFVRYTSSCNTTTCASLDVDVDVNCFLPIEWLYFEAKKEKNFNNLQWATASEDMTAYFEVERSRDGVNFEQIGTVTSVGNSLETSYYQFNDSNPFNGTNYYRLKLINIDESDEFSEIAVLENKVGDSIFNVYPNPSKNILNISYNIEQDENVKIELIDVLGRVVKSKIISASVGQNNLILEITEFTSGTYNLRITYLESGRINIEKVVVN